MKGGGGKRVSSRECGYESSVMTETNLKCVNSTNTIVVMLSFSIENLEGLNLPNNVYLNMHYVNSYNDETV